MDDVSVFVLAGGRSSRMGSDKALLPFGRANLLQLALEKAGRVAANPLIVASRERYSNFGEVVEDVIPGCGPLGGIHAALATSRTEVNLVWSVDMPLMTVDFLLWLLDVAATGSEHACVPEAAGRLQPLCAVYRRDALEEVEAALRSGDFKVDRLLARLPTRRIAEHEWRAAGFAEEIFCNVNTPEEYAAVSGGAEGTASPQEPGPQI